MSWFPNPLSPPFHSNFSLSLFNPKASKARGKEVKRDREISNGRSNHRKIEMQIETGMYVVDRYIERRGKEKERGGRGRGRGREREGERERN